jgi:geranylgeranyl pyrophosphate synthase
MRHALLLGGKRLRPALACAACEAFGGKVEAGLAAGVALELVHAYSLVHDDLPAMDDDALRRGHPTVHVAFDEATAILAGDGLLTLAFDHLARSSALADAGATGRIAMVAALARAAGPSGMVAGQALDMAATGNRADETTLARIHAHKTGALITAAVVLGGLAAGLDGDAPEAHTLRRFGDLLGLAFQIVDDLLDATGETATLGKTAGADAALDKSTYVGLLGVEETRARAERVCEQALTVCTTLSSPGRLPDFVHWVRDRDH